MYRNMFILFYYRPKFLCIRLFFFGGGGYELLIQLKYSIDNTLIKKKTTVNVWPVVGKKNIFVKQKPTG